MPGSGAPVPNVADADARNDAATTAREACGKRVFLSLAICIEEKCQEPRFRQTQECVGIVDRKAARELR